jgi:hypothetical protein
MSSEKFQERICTLVGLDKINNIIANSDPKKVTAAFYRDKVWGDGSNINVRFTDLNPIIKITPLDEMDTTNGPIDPIQQEYINNSDSKTIPKWIEYIVKQRIEPIVNLSFTFDTANPWNKGDYVSKNTVIISFNEGTATSLVGTDVNEGKYIGNSTMNLGWFDVATVIHEFGHVLGLVHEHQNPRGPIDWNIDKVYDYYESDPFDWSEERINTNIIKKYDKEQINGSEFDPCSIMLYFFPANITNNGVGQHQNLRLSGTDIKYISEQYPQDPPINPAQIYNQFYGGDIETNISQCNAKRNPSFVSKIIFTVKKYWYIPVSLLVLTLVVVIVIIVLKRRRDNSGRVINQPVIRK